MFHYNVWDFTSDTLEIVSYRSAWTIKEFMFKESNRDRSQIPFLLFSSKKLDNTLLSSSVHGEKEKRKSRVDQSALDGERAKDLKEKDNKKKKEKKEEKPAEEKYCKPGMSRKEFTFIRPYLNTY